MPVGEFHEMYRSDGPFSGLRRAGRPQGKPRSACQLADDGVLIRRNPAQRVDLGLQVGVRLAQLQHHVTDVHHRLAGINVAGCGQSALTGKEQRHRYRTSKDEKRSLTSSSRWRHRIDRSGGNSVKKQSRHGVI